MEVFNNEAEGEGSDAEGGAESRQPRRAQTPFVPTDREREDHRMSGHAAYRSWCKHCVCGRGRNTAHASSASDAEPEFPVISFDYCYLGSRAMGAETAEDEAAAEAEGQNPVLVMTDSRSKGIYAMMHLRKGTQFEGVGHATRKWVNILDGLGYRRVIFRSDNEPAIVAFLTDLKKAWSGEVVPERSDVGEPQSNGAAEGAVGIMKGMVRTVKLAFEEQIGTTVPADHVIITWILHHATAMQRRFRVGADGRTPNERLVGRKVGTQMAEFGEQVWYMALRGSGDRLPSLGERYLD